MIKLTYTLIILIISSPLFAEQTGNLVINGTFENNNSNNWTTSGDVQVLNDCCGSNYDLEFGDYGSIEQSFNLTSDTITQPMLDNGITLNSSVQVQNGECGVSGCWGGSGPADTFTIRLQIRDEDSNVLATTTQERTNVTGINGKDFTDSVSYTGTGSNIGNIFLSGSDGNSPNTLGGPNLDFISVIMTYDPVVLSVSQTEEINTTLTFVGEVEQEIETIFFEPIKEIRIEEYRQPELATLVFKEFLIEELAQEEINTGIINIFEEVTYEEPKTIEAFTTEVQGFEERIEATESFNNPTASEVIQEFFEEERETIIEASNSGGITERETPLEEIRGGTETGASVEETERGGNEPAPREGEEGTASEPTRESEVSESNTETVEQNETVATESETETVATEEVTDETVGEGEATDSERGSEGAETVAEREETLEGRDNEVEESGSSANAQINTQTISVADIERKVNATVKRIDQRLALTSMIVTRAMSKNSMLDSYTNINQDIFKDQLQIDGGNYYETREYIDNRNIYAQNQNVFFDPMATYQRNVQETVDEVIRAEENLRRIRGY